ncbi:hypothetical protein D3C86_1941350 [compost metagenome]
MIDQQNRRCAKHLLTRQRLLRLGQQSVGQTRFEAATTLQRLQQQTLKRRIEPNHLHFTIPREPQLRNSSA